MDFKEYEQRALSTRVKSALGLTYCALGLTGEAGEVADKVKKSIRDGVFDKQGILKELGDTLWYLTAAAADLGYSLEDVAIANVEKVESRKQRDKISGSGDNR